MYTRNKYTELDSTKLRAYMGVEAHREVTGKERQRWRCAPKFWANVSVGSLQIWSYQNHFELGLNTAEKQSRWRRVAESTTRAIAAALGAAAAFGVAGVASADGRSSQQRDFPGTAHNHSFSVTALKGFRIQEEDRVGSDSDSDSDVGFRSILVLWVPFTC
ncbi:hypothetical protein E2542_SST07114 [Spatholobus suberectus]|nr:hypothetical protein E2542_SST07114 [Spatholobus suberectus]